MEADLKSVPIAPSPYLSEFSTGVLYDVDMLEERLPEGKP
jgi:hypothetical protein